MAISQGLGHARIETTNCYSAVNLETKHHVSERAGPVTGTLESVLTTWRTDPCVLEWLEAL